MPHPSPAGACVSGSRPLALRADVSGPGAWFVDPVVCTNEGATDKQVSARRRSSVRAPKTHYALDPDADLCPRSP